jgi:antitoxin HicB
MTTYRASLLHDPASGTWTITFPDFGWGVSQGQSLPHSREMAGELLHDLLAHLIRRDEPIPTPRKHPGRQFHSIHLPPFESAKVELYRALKASGLRKAELARRLGTPRANVNRLFDLDHATRFELLEAAFHALGKRLVIAVEDAA